MVNVFDSTNQYVDEIAWVLEGDQILCDYETIYIKYIARPDDVSELDSLATQAMISNLALKLCVPLQLDDSWSARIHSELYQVILPQARSIDTFENKELLLEESNWILGRNYDYPII